MTPDEARRARIAAMLETMPFTGAWGVEVVSADAAGTVIEAPLVLAHEAQPGAFAAAAVGSLGDMAAVTSIYASLPAGWACATLDFTVKMLAPARGPRLRAVGRVLQPGRTTAVGAAEVYILAPDGTATLCGAVLATARCLGPRA